MVSYKGKQILTIHCKSRIMLTFTNMVVLASLSSCPREIIHDQREGVTRGATDRNSLLQIKAGSIEISEF